MKLTASPNRPDAADSEKGRPQTPRFPRPIVAIAFVVLTYLFITDLIAPLIFGVYIALQRIPLDQAQQWLEANTIAQFLYSVLAYGLVAAAVVMLLKAYKLPLAAVGIRRPKWSDVGLALLALPVYFIAYGVLLTVVSELIPQLNIEQEQQIGFEGDHSIIDLSLIFLSLAIIPPLVEEFLMRGFLFSALRARTRMVIAVIVTSLIFAVGHLQFGSGAPPLWVAAIDTFILSLFLIYLRVRTDRLWASILLHAFKNTIAFIMIFILHKG